MGVRSIFVRQCVRLWLCFVCSSVFICLWNVRSVQGLICMRKIMAEYNQMGCVCLCFSVCLRWDCLCVGSGSQTTDVCCSKWGFHSVKFDTSPHRLFKSHNNFGLDLCCYGHNFVCVLPAWSQQTICPALDGHLALFQRIVNQIGQK